MIRRSSLFVVLPAVLAFAWVVVRAATQSVTIDEAVTYNLFVDGPPAAAWVAGANNHVLNTILIKVSTHLLGLSPFTLRLPALLGALFYISGTCWLVNRIAAPGWRRTLVFACLVLNPFVLDYLVAARGYSLAAGFMVCGIGAGLSALERRSLRSYALMSTLIGLSFAANFSFGIVDAMILLCFWLAALRGSTMSRAIQIGAALSIPAALVTALIAGPVLMHWPRAELTYGATSLSEMFGTLTGSSFYQLPQAIRAVAAPIASVLPWLAMVLALALIPMLHAEHHSKPLVLILIAAVVSATVLHWLMFRFMGIPLPRERTGIWLVILFTLAASALLGAVYNSAVARACQIALLATMLVSAVMFLACLRLSYFKEWKWDADSKRVYDVLASYNHKAGYDRVSSHWLYSASLEFYRRQSGRESFQEILPAYTPLPDARLYVLERMLDSGFIESEALKPVYSGPYSAVIAIREQPRTPNAAPPLFSEAACNPASGCRLVDDTSKSVQWSGAWIHGHTFDRAAGSTISFSNVPKSAFRFQFEGTAIVWGYAKAPNRGIASVFIDDRPAGTVNLFAPTIDWQAHSQFTVERGRHTFEVRVTGRKDPKAEDCFVDLDVMRVEGR